MTKIFNIAIVFILLSIFFSGCSDQEECTSHLNGEIVEVYTPEAAANTMTMLENTLRFNSLILEYLEQNRRAYSIKKSLDKNTSYSEDYKVIYNYSMSDYNISFLNYTSTLNIDIETTESFSEDENLTYKSNSLGGNISILDTITLDVSNIEYDRYVHMYKKDENESAEYLVNSLLSYSSDLNPCANGIYDIETEDPLIKSHSGTFSDGTLNVNGTLFKFNDGGSADVFFDDGSVAYGVTALESSCE